MTCGVPLCSAASPSAPGLLPASADTMPADADVRLRRRLERLSARPGAAHRARRPGLRRPAAGGRARPAGRCGGSSIASASCRSTRSTCSRARTTCRSSAAPARTTPSCWTARRTTRRGGCSSTGATRRRCCPSRTQPLLRWRMARAARGGLGRHAADPRERPELVAEVLEEVRARGPVPPARCSRRAAEAHRPVVGLERRQAGARVPVLERADHVGAAARLRAPLRPARARAARRGARDADAGARTPSASCCAIAARALGVASRSRPARLLPAAARRDAQRASPSSSRRAS